MLFKYNHKNPKLRRYYDDTVEHARTDASNDLRFWKLVVYSFIIITFVALLILIILVFGDAIKQMVDAEYVTAEVLPKTVIRLTVIFGVSAVILILATLCLRRAIFNYQDLEEDILLNSQN